MQQAITKIDFSRAITQFPYYAANLLKIRTKARQFVSFRRWWPAQYIFWKKIEEDLQNQRPVRKIVLKARQQGISTLVEGIAFWQIHTVPNTRALVLAHERDSSSYIYEMSRTFYENLPIEYRPLKKYSSKKELVFSNPDEKTALEVPGLRSSIEVQTAGKFIPPRGPNWNIIHFSEVAFWPGNSAREIIPALIPTVAALPGSMIVYESTANGVNNFFFEQYQSAKEANSTFEAIFIPWYEMPEYYRKFANKDEQADLQRSLDDEEKEFISTLQLSLEQINWRRWKISEMNNDVDYFRQEYPSNDREAFVFSGFPIFDRKILREFKIRPAIFVGDIDIFRRCLREDSEGCLQIWEHPQKEAKYTVGVDIASGTAEDYTCFQVLKSTFPDGVAQQVAEWYGKVDPVEAGQLCVFLANYYNEALLSIELNNHGLTTQVEAQRSYWNFYQWRYLDRDDRKVTTKVGWTTTMATKPILIDRTQACLRERTIDIVSQRLLDEMWLYVRIPGTVSYEAETGNDDRVMAYMISLTTLYLSDHNILNSCTNLSPYRDAVPEPPTQADAIFDLKDPRLGWDLDDNLNWLVL
jgi:hypothetical protein